MSLKRSRHPASAGVMAFLEEHAGLVFPSGRLGDVERSIARIAARCGAHDAHGLIERLRTDRPLLDELVADLVVGETYFFREPQQFESIRKIVLPELRRSRPTDVPLQVWSAGCATGEEPYSLAILLEQEGLAGHSNILATDVSAPALKKAARGNYEHWSFRGTKDDFAANYFRARGGKFHLLERVRDRVKFAQANLADESYPRPRRGRGFDLILCRNVLIYFSARAVGEVAQRLFESLNDGGWLVTAPSDPPLWDFAPFKTAMTAGGIFYCKTGASPARTKSVAALLLPPMPLAPVPMPAARKKTPGGPTPEFRNSAEACEAHATLLFAGGQPAAALNFLSRAVIWHPLSRELHYLYAIGLLNRNKAGEAAEIAKRLIYLDRHSVAGHMLLGTIAQRLGDRAGAMRAYRNGLSSCREAGEDEIVPLTGNERYGRMAAALAAQIATLQSAGGAR